MGEKKGGGREMNEKKEASSIYQHSNAEVRTLTLSEQGHYCVSAEGLWAPWKKLALG